jgi:hypothetical protein
MLFELWDIETRYVHDEFDTVDAALDHARDLIQEDPVRYPAYLALAQMNEDETTTWIARGDGLTQMLHDRAQPSP